MSNGQDGPARTLVVVEAWRSRMGSDRGLFEEPRFVREALAVFEALRRLGFAADDIHFKAGLEGTDQFAVILKPDTPQQFVVTVGEQGMVFDEATRRMQRAAHAWNDTTDEVRQWIWGESDVYRQSEQLVESLLGRGLRIPRMDGLKC